MSIIDESEQFAKSEFKKLKPPYGLWYLLHSKYVGIAALAINPELDKEIMWISAWLHDVGKVKSLKGHARISAKIAKNFLKGKLNKEKLAIVVDCIGHHGAMHKPKTREGKVFQSADKTSMFYPEVRKYLAKHMKNGKLKQMLDRHYSEIKLKDAKKLALAQSKK